ncbi:PREDICTED: olfactory receptor 14C36-like [Dipodomys ordii]|uniref:Olfactory receptor 14C36-like n=1 Tax=Dipodomys ordii TaxID=10020 RepID=A0A1S3F2S1_DIPOR|nr:PREDICTED: olfactory receptor 14C36-like [Dipodomys ordii]
MGNTSMVVVTVFLLEGFAEVWELRFLLSMSYLLMYLATLLGNLIIITVTTIDRNLHTPMYFFLRNLSILDMCYISVTVPNICVNSFINNRIISRAGCVIQIFLVIYCAFVETLFLTIMARDRYVAICQPLHYPVIMNHQFCVQTTLASILIGLIYAAVHTGNTFRLSFCQSNMVPQFFCDIPSLLRLSCSDTFSNKLLIFISVFGAVGGCFIFIVMSYVRIFSTVLKFPVKEERGKAFSTCVPHILVVSVFFSCGAVVYLRPPVNSEMIQGIILSVCYTIIPPFLNPIIYSLRNKQIQQAFRKIILRISIIFKIEVQTMTMHFLHLRKLSEAKIKILFDHLFSYFSTPKYDCA